MNIYQNMPVYVPTVFEKTSLVDLLSRPKKDYSSVWDYGFSCEACGEGMVSADRKKLSAKSRSWDADLCKDCIILADGMTDQNGRLLK